VREGGNGFSSGINMVSIDLFHVLSEYLSLNIYSSSSHSLGSKRKGSLLITPSTPVPTDFSHEENGNGKWFFSDRVYSYGIDRSTCAPTAPLLPVLGELYIHCGGKLELNESNLPEFTPSHPHVLFSL
jgi:hypothetical protein